MIFGAIKYAIPQGLSATLSSVTTGQNCVAGRKPVWARTASRRKHETRRAGFAGPAMSLSVRMGRQRFLIQMPGAAGFVVSVAASRVHPGKPTKEPTDLI